MRYTRVVLSVLGAALIAPFASAVTITGLTPSTLKVKVGQQVTLTLTATGISAQGPAACFFWLAPGDGNQYPGPETMASWFVGGSATLKPFSYAKAGTFTVTIAPRGPAQASQSSLLGDFDESLVAQGVQVCEGAASATVTVWDPYTARPKIGTLNPPPPPAGESGPSKPGGGPVEMTSLKPGVAVALNPQPLPPGAHTEALQTGGGGVGRNNATMLTTVPYVRAVAVTPPSVLEGAPVQLAITADAGCNAVLIAWGDGTTLDQSLDSSNPKTRSAMQRPIQHVYRKIGAETVKVSGEHGCLGMAAAAVTVTMPLQAKAPVGVVSVVHH